MLTEEDIDILISNAMKGRTMNTPVEEIEDWYV